MRYEIGNFIVYVDKCEETDYRKRIAVPTEIKNGEPANYKWKYRTRKFITFNRLEIFNKVTQGYTEVTSDIFTFIDLIEILRAFATNKLIAGKMYQISNSFAARLVRKDGNIILGIHFEGLLYTLFFDKFECSSLASKFSKILQRCEVRQEQGVYIYVGNRLAR